MIFSPAYLPRCGASPRLGGQQIILSGFIFHSNLGAFNAVAAAEGQSAAVSKFDTLIANLVVLYTLYYMVLLCIMREK